jgi:hypothetical protein
MYQTIGEDIEVIGIFKRGKLLPRKFQWRQQILDIQEVTMINDTRDGGIRKRFYSVMSGGNLFRLSFNRESEIWKVEEIWCE